MRSLLRKETVYTCDLEDLPRKVVNYYQETGSICNDGYVRQHLFEGDGGTIQTLIENWFLNHVEGEFTKPVKLLIYASY